MRGAAVDLYWHSSDGSGTTQLLHSSPFHKDAGSWHEGSGLFAFGEDNPRTGWDIWLHHADSTPAAWPLIETEVWEYHPMISPDGMWLAFVSERTGRREVNLTPLRSGGAVVPVSTGGGDHPLWSPDGRELFYYAGDSLMAVDVSDRNAPRRPTLLFTRPFGEPRAFGAPNYSISSDGERFLMLLPASRSQTEVGVITDFFGELCEPVGGC